jgi:hypothetical protein
MMTVNLSRDRNHKINVIIKCTQKLLRRPTYLYTYLYVLPPSLVVETKHLRERVINFPQNFFL